MKILSVSSSVPYPPDHATRNRAWHLIRRLAKDAEVTVLTWAGEDIDPTYLEAVSETVNELVCLPIRSAESGWPTRMRRRLSSMTSALPPFMIERMERQRTPQLAGPFDVAVAEDDAALPLMPKDLGCPRVVHRHNIFSQTIAGLYASNSLGTARRMKWALEMPTWARFDRYLSTSADLSIVTTPEARLALSDVVPDSDIEVVENGASVSEQVLGSGDLMRVVFVGTMNYEPNADAAVRFSKRVWPRVLERFPDAEFHIVGRAPLREVQRLHIPGVKVVGTVPDVTEACRGARLAVVPLNAGSGIKTKTLEFMSLGLPVVATPCGAEGIDADRQQGLWIAKGDDELVDGITHYLKDAELAKRTGLAARRYVEERFSWDATTHRYSKLLADVASGHRSRRSGVAR